MPVMLKPDQYEPWLTGKEEKELLDLLAPFPDPDLEAYPVDPRVNKPIFNEPKAIERKDLTDPQTRLDLNESV